ncbi:hypothetical protein HID58_066245 [Brassica napus]|uniref:Uncharacterized protein n=1 Tax=Brassica napus TaxID=3708 RepID=A0ABQ7ZF64_BRANA|nr:hypothetical protein HID58_066245 [Brassica napus]
MSRLVPKISPLIHKNRRSVRLLSSSKTGPCVSVCNVVQPSPDGGNIGKVLLYDVAKFELVRTEKTFPDELHEAQLVGASRGWSFFFNREDRSVVISDFLNPYASKTEPKMFPLPTFTTMPTCQIEVVCNVAMSSSPEPYDKDWGVGVTKHMETTIGAHHGTGDSSSPQDSSAVTEPTAQPDSPISATTDHPGMTSTQLAAMATSDHLANTLTLVATTSGDPSMVATSDHLANTSTLVATTSGEPSMVATSDHSANTPTLVATTSGEPSMVAISDHLANASTLVATTSDNPSMVATSDHPANTSTLMATTSTQPSMVTTSALPANNTASMVATSTLPAAVTTSRHPAGTTSLILTTSVQPINLETYARITTPVQPTNRTTAVVTPAATQPPNTRTMYSTQADISLIFQTLLGRIDELARGTTSRLDDLAHSQIACNNRINELQSVEIGASRSQQVDITPRLQRVLFNDLPTPVTGSGQQRSIQANDLRAPITSSGQQHQNHVNKSSAPIIDSRQQRPHELEPEDDELNPTSPRHRSVDNGKLGIASDKLEQGDELGTTGNKLGTKTDELEKKSSSTPPMASLCPPHQTPHLSPSPNSDHQQPISTTQIQSFP